MWLRARFPPSVGCTLEDQYGRRPPGGPSDDQLKRLANTLNEIGRQTIAMGIRLAPHPHIWGPLEREKEIRRAMELTDPKYVWMTADTGQLVLGGGDAAQIISDYFPASPKCISRTPTPNIAATPPRRRRSNIARPAFITIWAAAALTSRRFKVLRDKHYKGWAIFDLDGPRKGDDGFEAIGGNLDVAVDNYRPQHQFSESHARRQAAATRLNTIHATSDRSGSFGPCRLCISYNSL